MTCDVNQRYAEIDALCASSYDLKSMIDSFYNQVHVVNAEDENLIFDRLDTENLSHKYGVLK